MVNNDVIILDSLLSERKKKMNDFEESLFFDLFAFEQSLKNYDLSYDELLFGNVDGGNDGGIDGFFLFLNEDFVGDGFIENIRIDAKEGGYVEEDDETTIDDVEIDLKLFKKNPVLELFIIQSKASASFGETAFDHIIPTLNDLFDLSKSIDSLKNYYNVLLLEKVNIFRKIFIALSSLHPTLKISFVYASKGNTENINPRIENRADILKNDIKSYFDSAETEVVYLGARELLNLSRIDRKYTLQLKFIANYLSGGENSYILLSKLRDYYEFIIDENENIIRYIFDSNVRDYQGRVEVNKDIQQTLEIINDDLNFWWLNNGITILASNASISGTTINLDDVQIINGLQTTYNIYKYFKDDSELIEEDERSVSIKIIVIDQDHSKVRDRIIKATNFQTAIQPYSLRATDQIQRDIEDYFLNNGWFYDRRKNFYKNMGKPANKIVSIQLLSQAYMAIILRRPHNARSNPVSLIKTDTTYKRIFNDQVNPDIYLFCAKTMKIINSFLREYSSQDMKILKYHLAMISLMKHFKKLDYTPQELITLMSLENNGLSSELMQESLAEIEKLGNSYIELNGGDFNKVSKTKEFVNYLEDEIILP